MIQYISLEVLFRDCVSKGGEFHASVSTPLRALKLLSRYRSTAPVCVCYDQLVALEPFRPWQDSGDSPLASRYVARMVTHDNLFSSSGIVCWMSEGRLQYEQRGSAAWHMQWHRPELNLYLHRANTQSGFSSKDNLFYSGNHHGSCRPCLADPAPRYNRACEFSTHQKIHWQLFVIMLSVVTLPVSAILSENRYRPYCLLIAEVLMNWGRAPTMLIALVVALFPIDMGAKDMKNILCGRYFQISVTYFA